MSELSSALIGFEWLWVLGPSQTLSWVLRSSALCIYVCVHVAMPFVYLSFFVCVSEFLCVQICVCLTILSPCMPYKLQNHRALVWLSGFRDCNSTKGWRFKLCHQATVLQWKHNVHARITAMSWIQFIYITFLHWIWWWILIHHSETAHLFPSKIII